MLVLKQLAAVIDGRTTPICLNAAGQIRAPQQPYDTIAGAYDEPPFHVHCRSISVPWMPGFVSDLAQRANAELVTRSARVRRLADGREPNRIPPAP